MKKVWAWVSGPLWRFLNDHWKLLAGIALALAALWAGRKVEIALGPKPGPVTVPGGKVTVRRDHDPL